MQYTLGQAAKATGKNKTIIQRAIKAGKLSADFKDGQYSIDPAELHRVFPPLQHPAAETPQSNDPQQAAPFCATVEEPTTMQTENRQLLEFLDDLRLSWIMRPRKEND